MELESQDYRSLPPDVQEDLRRRGVQAVLSGKTQVEVAKAFGVTRQAVNNWMKAYRGGGAKALGPKPKGRPRSDSNKARAAS